MDLKNSLIVLAIAAAPFVELRLAVPYGVAQGLSPLSVFILSVIGNTLPILPLLIFLQWAVIRLERLKVIGRILDWWFTRVKRKSDLVEKYGFWGLVLFVAIPLPGTGVWSGAVAATLFNFKKRRAAVALFIGMAIAAVIVTLASVKIITFIKV